MADGGSRPDPLHYWKAALIAVRERTPLPPYADGKPEAGYYWVCKIKNGPKLPVAVWHEDGECIMTIEGYPVPVAERGRMWEHCCRHPVEYKGMFDVREATGKWPHEIADEDAPPQIGDNSSAVGVETLAPDVLLTQAIERTRLWLEKTPIDSDARADECANRARELEKVRAVALEAHEDEKKPFLTRQRELNEQIAALEAEKVEPVRKCHEIDDKYLPLARTDARNPGRATIAIKFLFSKVDEWINHKKEAGRLAAQKIEDERLAALTKMEDDAKASAAKSNAAQTQVAPNAPSAPAAPMSPPPPPPASPLVRETFGGLMGNRAGQRPVKEVAFAGTTEEEIQASKDACYQHFKAHPDVAEALLKLAKAIVKNKLAPPPGIAVTEKTETR